MNPVFEKKKEWLIIFHIAGLLNYGSKPDPNP